MQDLPLDIQVQLNRIYDYGHLTRIQLIGYPVMVMCLEFNQLIVRICSCDLNSINRKY